MNDDVSTRYTLGTVTFNAIFTVVDVLVPTSNPILGGFNFVFYTIFPPYALYNGLVGLVRTCATMRHLSLSITIYLACSSQRG